MFIASLNHTKFNSCHLLLQQSFILSSIVTTIDDKNYFNETMVTGSCLDHSDVKGLVALQVLSCISSCWELAGRAVVSNCSLCGSFAGFAIFPAWELPGWTFGSLAWCILVAENIFHTKSPLLYNFAAERDWQHSGDAFLFTFIWPTTHLRRPSNRSNMWQAAQWDFLDINILKLSSTSWWPVIVKASCLEVLVSS